jgi:Asp/Glu/hydantoin racemase
MAVTLIHTVAGLAPVFSGLAGEVLPVGTRVVHLVDEELLQDTIRAGQIRAETRDRLRAYVGFAAQAGSEAVMVTCSSVGPAVDEIVAEAELPVLRVDAAMAEAAVRLGRRIGVLGTLATTLEPTAALIGARAAQGGAEVTVEARLAPGAFERLQAGDTRGHDERVLAELRTLLASADVVVLAQASMARVADQLGADERHVPILTSPRLGLERLREVLGTSTREMAPLSGR